MLFVAILEQNLDVDLSITFLSFTTKLLKLKIKRKTPINKLYIHLKGGSLYTGLQSQFCKSRQKIEASWTVTSYSRAEKT